MLSLLTDKSWSEFFKMQSSENFLFLSVFVLLTLMDSQGGKTDAGRMRPQSMIKSKRDRVLPLTREDIGQPWCKMQPFQQTIRRRGCQARNVTNNLCYGQCRSFYVPYRKNFFESCSYCTPVSSKTEIVMLNCPDRSPPSRVVKRVKIVTACSCRVCGERYI